MLKEHLTAAMPGWKCRAWEGSLAAAGQLGGGGGGWQCCGEDAQDTACPDGSLEVTCGHLE